MSPASASERPTWPVRPTGQGGVQRECPSGCTILNSFIPQLACSIEPNAQLRICCSLDFRIHPPWQWWLKPC
eukprot:2265334-Alexandrium_andersonii.AAC.1